METAGITSTSGFHLVSQTVIQSGCSCELPKYTHNVFAEERSVTAEEMKEFVKFVSSLPFDVESKKIGRKQQLVV